MIVRWRYTNDFDELAKTPHFLTGVSELLRAGRLGRHLVIIDRLIIARLLDFDISPHDRSFLERLAQQFTQTGRAHQFSTAYIEVANNQAAEPAVSGSAVTVPFKMLVTSDILEPAKLITENIDNDGWLYSIVIQYFAERVGRGHVSVELLHGGGADTPKVLTNALSEKRIVVTLVDSDRDCPTGPKSETLKKVEKICDDSEWVLAKSGTPPCREIENLIPIDILTALQCGVGHASNAILINIDNAEHNNGTTSADRHWNYFDLKKGQSSNQILKTNDECRQWITGKIALALDTDNDWEVPGYGDNIVSQLRSNGVRIAEFRRAMSTSHWNEKFGAFFSFIAWFFVGAQRLIT
ncbi:MAG: hypothetical protein P0Y65_03655 [Candidatus Devosia phytovorans]|uniref:Uncharacterized protein n=1 Tax=Candidatus Devosia phytovorans TaxID=3121372 RepID=A0AAJ6B1H8_9HYPH|nr:hypothetical protein [Devosia sp.]WEK05364.1 MAG: hypothetical protein P0Y65_03655 [Devosia sp.]